MPNTRNKEELLLKAASLYYMNGLTQEQIAKQFGLSRPTIVRMLKQAVDEGFVEIRLTRKLPHTVALETALEARYVGNGVQQVVVVDSLNGDPKASVGKAAAGYLQQNLRTEHILGIGWSSTLTHITAFLRAGKHKPERIVQLGGYVSGMGAANAQQISAQIGNILAVPVETIPAPVVVESSELCQALLRDPSVANTMHWVSKCNIGLVGIGVATKHSTLVQVGYLDASEIESVHDAGAVGEVLSHYFDQVGREIATPWFDRMISVDLATLKTIENLIGLAAGADKAEAVEGAVKCGILNTLIIDTPLAEALAESFSKP